MHSILPWPLFSLPSSSARSFADSSSRPLAAVSPLRSPDHSPPVPVSPSRPETARSHATRARPAGWHSVAFSAVHLRVSQSVSQSLSQSVGESGRSGTRERYHHSLSLSLSFSLSLSLSDILYVTTVYSHLSLSLSFSPLVPTFLLVYPFLRCASFFFSPFPLFTRSLRAGDRVARPVRHGFSSSSLSLSLSSSFSPPSASSSARRLLSAFSCGATAGEVGARASRKERVTVRRDRRSVSRERIRVGISGVSLAQDRREKWMRVLCVIRMEKAHW